jgi:hypothetical protein
MFEFVTVDDPLAINTKFYNCVVRNCRPGYSSHCCFVNYIFEKCSPPADGKFEVLTIVLDDSKEGFELTLLPTNLKGRIVKHAIRWRCTTQLSLAPPLIEALHNVKRENNRLKTSDHELAVQNLSRENVYRLYVEHGKLLTLKAMRNLTIRHLDIK